MSEEFSRFELEGEPIKPANAAADALTWNDPANLLEFLAATQAGDYKEADRYLIDRSYRVATWHFRKAAISGDFKAARSLEIYLRWAAEVLARPRADASGNINAVGSAQFLPRTVVNQ
jgi:hypothetical protein